MEKACFRCGKFFNAIRSVFILCKSCAKQKKAETNSK
jgi:hypothetical protein